MKRLLDYFLAFVYKSSTNKPMQLGRWSLKNCESSHATSFYANRDHCGDTLCKMPKKYDDKDYHSSLKEKPSEGTSEGTSERQVKAQVKAQVKDK